MGATVNTLKPLNKVREQGVRKRDGVRTNCNCLVCNSVMETEPIAGSHRRIWTVCSSPRCFDVTNLLHSRANKPAWMWETDGGRQKRMMRWWHHIGHQGDERSKPQVNSMAENRRWVTPASLHQQPIGEPLCHILHQQMNNQSETYCIHTDKPPLSLK